MGADSADLLASTLVDAQVDLNPHQAEAALFAFQSPLSKGVILADEVGLGKTTEAGLVMAQRWANLTLKKIPKMVKDRCEWGHDGYNLNVANQPMAQKKVTDTSAQVDLFGRDAP